ncbi:MAG: DUF3298 domain-containing protein [Proteobacteria bacterium]|nr:DUF3298 domain-containing protein [Pseudomonadota bacterium]
MKRWMIVAGLLVAAPALAQAPAKGPSFDCAKAQSVIDKAICKDAELSKADRELVAAYTALLDRLKGAERETVVKSQGRWVASRNRVCASREFDAVTECLKGRYAQRTATLQSMIQAPFAMVDEQTLTGSGKFGQVGWSYDIVFPRFEAKGVDFAAANTRFANDALKSAQEATPSDLSDVDDERTWEYQQSFSIERAPGGTLATVVQQFYGYTGGAHGFGATVCSTVDLRTGKIVTPAGVFAGDQWLRPLYQLVVADLRRQFKEREGDEDSLKPESMNKMLRENARFCWLPKHLEIVFNQYDVGSYAAGPYFVDLPYDRLKPMLRADGPIALR